MRLRMGVTRRHRRAELRTTHLLPHGRLLHNGLLHRRSLLVAGLHRRVLHRRVLGRGSLLHRGLLGGRLEPCLLRVRAGARLSRVARLTRLDGLTMLDRPGSTWTWLARPLLHGGMLLAGNMLRRARLTRTRLTWTRLRAVLLVHLLHGRRLHDRLPGSSPGTRRRSLFAPRLLRAGVVPPVRHPLSFGPSRHPTNARRALVSRKSTVAA